MTIITRVKEGMLASIRRQLQREFVRFCLVGAVGFLVNLGTLRLLYDTLHVPFLLAAVMGGEISLVSNFLFHNYWTYKEHAQNKAIAVLFMQFHLAFWIGNGINFLLTSIMVLGLKWSDTIALAIASGLVLFWNFAWTKFYIWRAKEVVAEES